MSIGRNAPCPCGSGKKYKKCCLPKQSSNPASDAMDELRALLQGREFNSLDELQAVANQLMQQRNHQADDDFHGLAPAQMHRFLHYPFASPGLIDFADHLKDCPQAPVLKLFAFLADALGDKGLKATKTCNLPRAFCRDAKTFYQQEIDDTGRTLIGNINQEQDFFILHIVRVVAELAGLVEKAGSRFTLTDKFRRIVDDQGLGGFYLVLLRTYALEYNWAYGDHYVDFSIIQQSFAFTLYLLSLHGDQWRANEFYEDCFINAFPMVLHEAEPSDYFDPETQVRKCYSFRCLERFLAFFGIVELEHTSKELYDRSFRIRARPILLQIVDFSA